MTMKIINLFFFVALLLIFSCDRDDDDDNVEISYESTGVIVGLDLTLCACCGGYLIRLEDSAENLNFDALPSSSDIELDKEEFPLAVKLNITRGISEACTNIIQIDAIEKE